MEEHPITKVEIITRPSKLEELKEALNNIGVMGMTDQTRSSAAASRKATSKSTAASGITSTSCRASKSKRSSTKSRLTEIPSSR